jgi:glycosyltransferase involved in cell wall biosynthesis
MRMAYICADSGVPVFGRKGCSIHVQEVLRAFLGLGVEVELFASRFGNPAPADLDSIRIHEIPVRASGEASIREQAALAANQDLRTALEHEGLFDFIYERYSLWSYAGMEYAQEAGIPGLLEVNAPLIEEQARYRLLVDRRSAESAAERAFAAAAGLVAISDEVSAYLDTYSQARGRVHVIPNGVNPDRFRAGLPPSCSFPDSFIIGFVGSLKPWHGLSTLVEAFNLLPRLEPIPRLLIVGDGPERSRVEAELSDAGLRNRAHLTGSVPAESIPGFLASMSVGVAPYPKLDSFYFSPLKVFEYLASGLPVVASRIGQLEEVIQDGKNGLFCEPGNAKSLAAALHRLHKDPEFCHRLGQGARVSAQKHTWEASVRRILEVAGCAPELVGLKEELRT